MKKRPILKGLLIFLGLVMIIYYSVYAITYFIEKSPIGDDKIGLIRLEGVIVDSEEMIAEFKRYIENPSVKAIIVRMDSPGGSVVPSQEIYDEIKKIKKEKGLKIVTSMGNVAASGAYYIASITDKIYANPGTITGSIGVIMESVNVEGLLKIIGVESMVIKSGIRKDIGSPFRKMKDDEKKILQDLLDDVHDQFITAVADGRKLNEDEVRKLADGRIFTGREAKRLGLVDELGNLEDTIKATAEMVGIKGEPRILESKKKFSVWNILKNQFLGKLGISSFPRFGFGLSYLLKI